MCHHCKICKQVKAIHLNFATTLCYKIYKKFTKLMINIIALISLQNLAKERGVNGKIPIHSFKNFKTVS